MPKELRDKLMKQAHKKIMKDKKGEHTGHQGGGAEKCPECKKHGRK